MTGLTFNSGLKINHLTVIEKATRLDRCVRFICKCDCGKETIVRATRLRSGETKSCGCANVIHRKHGLSGTRIQIIYALLRQRCLNPKATGYERYGGKGIKICGRWLGKNGLVNFLHDMGHPPEGRSLDRFPNKFGNYEPKNCRWATRKEQARNYPNNHLIEFRGKKQCIAAWAEEVGLVHCTISMRIERGWTAEQALTTPLGVFVKTAGRPKGS